MSDTSSAPETGELTVDAAAALLAAPPATPAAEAEAPATEPDEPDEEDQDPAEGDEPDGEQDDEAQPDASASDEEVETEEEEPAQPAIDPPVSWDAEARVRFAQLPRADQEYLAVREQQRDSAVAQAQQRAANAEKAAANVTQLGQALQQIIPQARAVLKSKWDAIDWDDLANTDPLEYVRKQREFENEKAQLQRLQSAQQTAHEEQTRQFQDAREQQLPTYAPELCGPEGNAKRTELSQYLVSSGVHPDNVRAADAIMLGLAVKAMQFERLQAQARATPLTPQPKQPSAAPAAPRVLRPSTTAAPAGNSRTRERDQAFARLERSGSVEDAVAALNAQRKVARR